MAIVFAVGRPWYNLFTVSCVSRTGSAIGVGLWTTMSLSGCFFGSGGPDLTKHDEAMVKGAAEGVTLLPNRQSDVIYSPRRLAEIAQSLREGAAQCFIRQALENVQIDPSHPGELTGVPEGQLKLRIRLTPGGKAINTEVLDSSFPGDAMPRCFAKLVEAREWPKQATASNQTIEAVYWTGFGEHPEAGTPEFETRVHRQAAEAGDRARACLDERVQPGTYTVQGLNLINSDGVTVASRVLASDLPKPVRECVEGELEPIRLKASSAFIRPIISEINYTMADDRQVAMADDAWLRLVRLEDQAIRAEMLSGTEDITLPDATSPAEPVASPSDGEPEPQGPTSVDPGASGLKLDLTGHDEGQ